MTNRPMSPGFLLIGIIGFFISVLTVYSASPTWGFTLSVFFLIIFLAAMVNLTRLSIDEALQRETDIVRITHRTIGNVSHKHLTIKKTTEKKIAKKKTKTKTKKKPITKKSKKKTVRRKKK